MSALIGALVVLACPQEPVPPRRGFFVYGDRVFLASQSQRNPRWGLSFTPARRQAQ